MSDSRATPHTGCPTCGQTYRFAADEKIAARFEANPRVGKNIASVCPECRRIDFKRAA